MREALSAAEEGPETPRQGDDHMAVRNGFENLGGDELPEGRLAFRVTRGAGAALFVGEGQEVLAATVRTADAGEAVSELSV